MKIGLFIPCYIDQFYPRVGIAVYEFLRRYNLSIDYPSGQTCCGQPIANSGMRLESLKYAKRFQEIFSGYDYVVSPSGSCVLHVREHSPDFSGSGNDFPVRKKTFEFVEFLNDVLHIDGINARFPHKVALLHGCHSLRGLRLETSSELGSERYSKNLKLLKQVKELEMISYEKEDECCGFGGTFSLFEERLSVRMGRDKLNALVEGGAEYVTGNDMSCMMHLEGLAKREKIGIKFVHIAEILNHIQ